MQNIEMKTRTRTRREDDAMPSWFEHVQIVSLTESDQSHSQSQEKHKSPRSYSEPLYMLLALVGNEKCMEELVKLETDVDVASRTRS